MRFRNICDMTANAKNTVLFERSQKHADTNNAECQTISNTMELKALW